MSQQQKRSVKQKEQRKRRNEQAFIFDQNFVCLGKVGRVDWEVAIAEYGGRVDLAAAACGLLDIQKDAKVLWGRSAGEALGTYRMWRKKKKKRG